MKVKCKDDNVTTKGLTLNKIYVVLSIEDCAGKLYRIIDDNGDNKRYSVDFFDIIDNNDFITKNIHEFVDELVINENVDKKCLKYSYNEFSEILTITETKPDIVRFFNKKI